MCPDNVDELVATCLAYQKQTILEKNCAAVLAQAIHNDFKAETLALQKAERDLQRAATRYNKLCCCQ